MSSPRGNYVVNSKGEILVGKPNFVYGTVQGYFSPQWKLYGLSERWNSSPILFEKLKEKMDRGETVEGYVHDIDHGSRRFWGGGKRLPKARMYLDRSLKVNSPMKKKTRKKVKMVRVLGETVRKGGVRYRYLLAERRNFLRRQRDPNSSYYGVPISELLKSNRRRGLRGNPRATDGMTPREKLRYYVSGAIARGEKQGIVGHPKGKIVKVLGHSVRAGSKRYYILMEQKRQFDDLARSENGPFPNRRRGLRRNPSESPSDYYYKLLRAGVPMDSHESDLYVKDTPTARAILADWPFGRLGRFKNNINGEIYIDIPFAYAPYWEKKVRR
jgi:hypothetical protein